MALKTVETPHGAPGWEPPISPRIPRETTKWLGQERGPGPTGDRTWLQVTKSQVTKATCPSQEGNEDSSETDVHLCELYGGLFLTMPLPSLD